MFHIVNDKGEEYIIDNESRIMASREPNDLWKRTYNIEYSDAPKLFGNYSEISNMLYASVINNNNKEIILMYFDANDQIQLMGKIINVNEFFSPSSNEINVSAINMLQGNSDEIENLLKNESLIDVLDNLMPLGIAHLIKYLESNEETKSLAKMANNYFVWFVYGSHAFTSDPDNYIEHFKLLKEDICS